MEEIGNSTYATESVNLYGVIDYVPILTQHIDLWRYGDAITYADVVAKKPFPQQWPIAARWIPFTKG